ncbi:MAG: cellobiose phosphorylase [Candidatus Omnitrophica bacterium]|nr:cellobiose phosphorylase [Candidatus Omnitrophota bacterium]
MSALSTDHTATISRCYVPLANEGGALSWTSPTLQGGLALSHHEYLTPPLTAEDLPHTLIRRNCWIVEPRKTPWSAATAANRTIDMGPGWFQLATRTSRFTVTITLWCPADRPEPIELMRITVTNTSARPLRFMPYAAIPMFCRSADHARDHRHVTVLLHRMRIIPHGVMVKPVMSFDERGHRPNRTLYTVLAFGPRGQAPTDVWAREEDFLGPCGTFVSPAAVWQQQRAPRYRQKDLGGREAIGAFRFSSCRLAPGASTHYLLLSGISRDPDRPRRWTRWAKHPASAARSLRATQAFWQEQSRRVCFSTADRALNGWLSWVNIQPVLRRLYGNSFLPQFDYGRGGRGWRDLWQDGLALLLSDPAAVKPMLLHNIGGVRIDGSNATIIGRDGRFIADRNHIPRTWMDHGAWPTHAILRYLDHTGDLRFLLEPRAYFRDPQLFRCRRRDEGWTEAYGFQLRTRRGNIFRGSVLQHLLVQHLTAFFNVGEHNVCRLEGADWNDGLDMAAERGESVAFTSLYAWNLQRLARLAERLRARGIAALDVPEELLLLLDRLPRGARVNYASSSAKRRRLEAYLQRVSRDVSGRTARVPLADLARDLTQKHDDLARRIQRQEWVTAKGEGWFNGYYDNAGRRVEGVRDGRVRMTLTGQVFPIMSGIATDEQVDRAIRAVNRFLRDPRRGGIRLNTNFGVPQPSLGRAFAFAYGEKENGAIFSHMAVMYAYALYVRRKPQAGREVWHALYRLANAPAAKLLPGLPEYFNAEGRGMYGYLTGSASWLIDLLLTQVYGVRGEDGHLVLDPQLTREDFGNRRELAVECTFAQHRLLIRYHASPHRVGASSMVQEIRVEGKRLRCVRRPTGGARIDRGLLERLHAKHPLALQVTLSSSHS